MAQGLFSWGETNYLCSATWNNYYVVNKIVIKAKQHDEVISLKKNGITWLVVFLATMQCK